MMNLENGLCPKQQIHGTMKFGMHRNTFTLHLHSPHTNIARFDAAMNSKGIFKHPG
jgi:hypothetical protein